MPKLKVPVIFEDPVKSPEEKIYIFLYNSNYSDDDEMTSCAIRVGRTAAYDFVKTNIDEINLDNAIVLAESRRQDIKSSMIKNSFVGMDEAITVIYFCKLMKNIFQDSFNIEDYLDDPEDREQGSVNQIPVSSEIMSLWNNAVSMQDTYSFDNIDGEDV